MYNNIDGVLDATNTYIKSDRYKNFIKNRKTHELVENRYAKRLFEREDFSEIIERIIEKYNSEAYKIREYNCGRLPEFNLYRILFDFARLNGREINSNFCLWQYELDGYVFSLCPSKISFNYSIFKIK